MNPPPQSTVESICFALAEIYKSPRLGNPESPLDDLIYLTMTNRTTATVAERTYNALKERFKNWDDVLSTPIQEIESMVREAGFAKLRTEFLYGFLKQIKTDFGRCDLSELNHYSEKKAFDYLVKLPGVSNKVAKCVMMYTLNFPVLPVDAHVFRVARRLGWTKKNRADLSHYDLELAVPAHLRYSFHVNAIPHGRACCRPQNPRCSQCPVLQYCDFGKKSLNGATI